MNNNDIPASRSVESSYSRANLADVLATLWAASSVQEVLSFTQGPLQCLLPHGAFACTIGACDSGAYWPKAVLTVNFPNEDWWSRQLSTGLFFDPFLRVWLATGEAQVVTSSDRGLDRRIQEALIRGGLRNVASYGVRDVTATCLSFFTFHRLPEGPAADHHIALKLVVPQLHSALAAIFHKRAGFSQTEPIHRSIESANVLRLTDREREVLNWVRLGKTNAEVASILGVSYKTVKNQVQTILVKLRVNNRTQAVAAALARGLIDLAS